jgi:hypothetical protein
MTIGDEYLPDGTVFTAIIIKEDGQHMEDYIVSDRYPDDGLWRVVRL